MLIKTSKNQFKKGAHKGSYRKADMHAIIDQSKLAHVAFVEGEEPLVIPTLAWRIGDQLYIHGANNSRMMRRLADGLSVCITFTLFDGWVLARSAMHHSAHYRSAMVFGCFSSVTCPESKEEALAHFMEQIAPGRGAKIRAPSKRELAATTLLTLTLEHGSVKISDKGPNDDVSDMNSEAWVGVIPYNTVVGPLRRDSECHPKAVEPDYREAYRGHWYQGDEPK